MNEAPIKNIVLVHGAFADGSSWAEVIARLQKVGFHAVAVQNPLTSLADDVAATKRILDQQDGSTLLVGHSYGGVVISEAGEHPAVAGLIYIAAMAPEAGEDFLEVAQKFPASPGGGFIRAQDGFAQLDETGFIENFAQDFPVDKAKVLAALQGQIAATLFAQKTTTAAWQTKPSWYQISTYDRMIAPELERFYAERMKAKKTIELETSHASPITRPDEVAELIITAAKDL